MHALIVGAGIGGLTSALTLARRGHRVTLLERDATPVPADASAAFDWDRSGAPQVRHSHAFLARMRNLLRDHHPDVLADLLAAGAAELRMADHLPDTITDHEPRPGDDDIVMLACRRTTFEWVLRRAVAAQEGVEVLDGVAVEGLVSDAERDGLPVVTGVTVGRRGRTEVLSADVVVVTGGRRSALPDWLAALGAAPIEEELEDTDIVYLSRFYRLRDDEGETPDAGLLAGDLGYLKFALFSGDNRAFSVTMAPFSWDRDLRRLLADPDAFNRAAAELPPIALWIRPDVAEPITDVHVMAGLVSRLRRLVVDGRPVALGVHAIGDAAVCTNPLYGRGCSLAAVHAHLLADVLDEHHADPVAAALALHEATEEHLVPWYRASVDSDRRSRAAGQAGPDAEPDPVSQLITEGLLPAARLDADVHRAFMRALNLLDPPDAMLRSPELLARITAIWQDKASHPPQPDIGPKDRDDLLGLLTAV